MNIQQMVRRFRLMDENLDTAGAGGGTGGDSGGSDVSGGVGNGQATGTGQVSESFNTSEAVDLISESLFGRSDEGKKDETKVPPGAPAESEAENAAAVEAAAAAAAKAAADAGAVKTPAPKTWKPEEQATWDAIPEAAKAAILRREEDIFKGIEQYKAPAEFGSKVQSVLQPYEQIMRANSMDPVLTISNLLQAHHTLATGRPEVKVAFLQDLAKQYGINLGAAQDQGQNGFDPIADPEVMRLRAELDAVQSRQQSLEQQRYEEVRVKMADEVNAFAADPKNVHFNKVAELMVPMLKDKSVSLAQAYEKAVWLNPETRDLEIARIASEKQAKAIADGKAAAEAARKAQAANVKVGPKAGAATTPLGSMDDTMNEVMARITSRG